MAKGTITEPAFVALLDAALQSRVCGAAVTHEQVRRDRYRFIVVSDQFAKIDHPERQQQVWKIAEKVVPIDDIWNVAMIITMAPAEVSPPGGLSKKNCRSPMVSYWKVFHAQLREQFAMRPWLLWLGLGISIAVLIIIGAASQIEMR